MDSEKIDIERVRTLYNQMDDIWPASDKWYTYTHQQMMKYIDGFKKKYAISDSSKIVNIGSAGNEYNIPGEHYHVDIAEERIKHCSRFYVGSAEKLPFPDNCFDIGLCVGSVINYCDPLLVISEISRVLKPNAVSVLDFEQSRSYQFIGSSFNCNARIITSFNSGVDDRIWIFSERIIRSYCKMHGLKVKDVHYFHLLTPLIYLICKDENKAANFTFADKVLRWIPYLRKISCNVILTVQKSAK